MSDIEELLLFEEGQHRTIGRLQSCEDTAQIELQPQPYGTATFAQTAFNLINVYMGIGLLSMPYAMKLSGWSGLASLAMAAMLFCFSGKLIVRSFERLSDGPKSYARLGYAALGTPGTFLVLIFATLEFFGALCVTLIVIYKQIESFLPDGGAFKMSSVQLSVSVATVGLMPLLFIPSLRHLSHFSSLGVVSCLVVVAAVVAATVIDPHRKASFIQPAPGHAVFQKQLLQGAGIFAVSLSGHSSLPAIRSSMAEPQQFGRVLSLSFGTMFLVYSTVAASGYYYFGNATSQIITTDLAERAPFAGSFILVSGFSVPKLVNIFITCNAFSKLPLIVVVLQDMIVGAVPCFREGLLARPSTAYTIRLLLFAAASIVSYQAFDVLGILISLTGGICSMTCSLLLPALFFTCLHWRDLQAAGRTMMVMLLTCGACILLLILAQNIQAIRTQMQAI